MDQVVDWILVALGIYEALSRVVPTSRRWSIIGNILRALADLSDKLERKRKLK